MRRLGIIFLLSSTLLLPNSFSEYQKEQKGEFLEYKKEIEEDFNRYNKILEEELKSYKTNLEKYWKDGKLPDNNVWIEYSEDFSKRKIVDFEKNTITIESYVNKNTSLEEIQKNFMKDFGNLILEDTSSAYKKDKLMEALDKRFEKEISSYAKGNTDKKPLLADVYLGKEGDKDLVLNKNDISKTLEIAKNEVTKDKIKEKNIKGDNRKIVSITIDMPSDATLKKAKSFEKDVLKYSKKEKIDPALVFAIMHSESSFNPMARSYIPAYGLMQIVPKSAGLDVSKRIYGKEKIFSPKYLYDSSNNIMAGTTYLNILYYSYLANIEDELSRYYCTIAAYNTGAGNVAKTFTKNTNINEASKIINKMTPEEVYKKLLKDLPYDETKNYLKKVSERSIIYEEALKKGL